MSTVGPTPKALPSTTFAGFAADSGELDELLEVEGTCPPCSLDELAREVHDGACLGAVEAEDWMWGSTSCWRAEASAVASG